MNIYNPHRTYNKPIFDEKCTFNARKCEEIKYFYIKMWFLSYFHAFHIQK